jgi:hypothetical protein
VALVVNESYEEKVMADYGDKKTEVHYVVHVKVEEVTRSVRRGPLQNEAVDREVEQLMVVTAKANDKSEAIAKATKMLSVEEES